MPPTTITRHTYCRICPVLCGLEVTLEGERVVHVGGDANHPLSQGYACAKGRALPRFHHHPQRLDRPRVDGRSVEWDELIDDLALRVRRALDAAGPDGVAVYHGTWSWMDGLGRRTAERLLRALGSTSVYSAITVDAVARSYVSQEMTGRSFAIPNFALDETELLVLIGTNPLVSHGHSSGLPHPARALRDVAARGELWVIDPRRTETARLATRHLAVRPGSDYVLVAHLVRELLRSGADEDYLAQHTLGVEELRAAVAPFGVDRVERECGVARADVTELVAKLRSTPRVAVSTGTGVTMGSNATVTEWLAWCLQIVRGAFDRPGGMWFNPGELLRLDERSFEPIDGAAPRTLPSRPDLPERFGERPCAGLVDEIESGHHRALFVIGGNPVVSLPETERLVPALRSLDALAVADVIESDTVALASHVLAVPGQLERADITQYSDLFPSRRSAQYTPAVVPALAERRPLWWILASLARRLDLDVLDGVEPDEADERELLEKMGRGRLRARDEPDVVIGEPARPRGWLERGVLPDGRWRLAPAPFLEQLKSAVAPSGLCLVPRRTTRRMNSALRDLDPRDEAVLLHPDDASTAGVASGDRVVVRSATGQLEAEVQVDESVRPGAVSIPHGLASANVSRLTTGRLGHADPLTGMVPQASIPVTVARADSAAKENTGKVSS